METVWNILLTLTFYISFTLSAPVQISVSMLNCTAPKDIFSVWQNDTDIAMCSNSTYLDKKFDLSKETESHAQCKLVIESVAYVCKSATNITFAYVDLSQITSQKDFCQNLIEIKSTQPPLDSFSEIKCSKLCFDYNDNPTKLCKLAYYIKNNYTTSVQVKVNKTNSIDSKNVASNAANLLARVPVNNSSASEKPDEDSHAVIPIEPKASPKANINDEQVVNDRVAPSKMSPVKIPQDVLEPHLEYNETPKKDIQMKTSNISLKSVSAEVHKMVSASDKVTEDHPNKQDETRVQSAVENRKPEEEVAESVNSGKNPVADASNANQNERIETQKEKVEAPTENSNDNAKNDETPVAYGVDYDEEQKEQNREQDEYIPRKIEKPSVVEDEPVSYQIEDSTGDSNFFTYFMVIVCLFISGYVGYHNRQKILALLLEGRRGRKQQRRRPNSANYRKLDSNLEEAITSSCDKSASNVIY